MPKKTKRKDWRIRLAEEKYFYKQIKNQKKKDNILEKPKQPICPNCNTELSVWNKCELCGWEKEKCKWKVLGKCWLKISEKNCKNCNLF